MSEKCANNGHDVLRARGKQIPSTRKTLELERSAFGEFQAGASHEVGNDSRDQHFARLRLRHDPGGRVNRDTADVLTSYFDLAGVKTGT